MTVMREQHVDLILLIQHKHDDQDVCFFAIHNPNGWTDLRGQELNVLKGYNITDLLAGGGGAGTKAIADR